MTNRHSKLPKSMHDTCLGPSPLLFQMAWKGQALGEQRHLGYDQKKIPACPGREGAPGGTE